MELKFRHLNQLRSAPSIRIKTIQIFPTLLDEPTMQYYIS